VRLRISYAMNVTALHSADPGPRENLSPGVAGDLDVMIEASGEPKGDEPYIEEQGGDAELGRVPARS
jgi:hypothetical protein